jgi:hypothetical protein
MMGFFFFIFRVIRVLFREFCVFGHYLTTQHTEQYTERSKTKS